jgi:MarR family transcriptional regulator, organic hydroperoxide resistance regulator
VDANRALWEKLTVLRRRLQAGMRGGGLSALTALDLTVPQTMVLFALVERQPLTITELTAVSGRTQGATSSLVTNLERRGLVAREADEQDGRRTRVKATRKARTLVADVEGLRVRSFDAVLAPVPKALVRRLDDALAAVLAAMDDR